MPLLPCKAKKCCVASFNAHAHMHTLAHTHTCTLAHLHTHTHTHTHTQWYSLHISRTQGSHCGHIHMYTTFCDICTCLYMRHREQLCLLAPLKWCKQTTNTQAYSFTHLHACMYVCTQSHESMSVHARTWYTRITALMWLEQGLVSRWTVKEWAVDCLYRISHCVY